MSHCPCVDREQPIIEAIIEMIARMHGHTPLNPSFPILVLFVQFSFPAGHDFVRCPSPRFKLLTNFLGRHIIKDSSHVAVTF